MHRWLCCTCQLEESYLSNDNEHLKSPRNYGDGDQKGSKVSAPVKPETQKAASPIEVPALALDELKEKADNFGSMALIGEGSYGRVFCATLNYGKAVAVKKLDVSSEPESDVEFLTQVEKELKGHNQGQLLTGYSELELPLMLPGDWNIYMRKFNCLVYTEISNQVCNDWPVDSKK